MTQKVDEVLNQINILTLSSSVNTGSANLVVDDEFHVGDRVQIMNRYNLMHYLKFAQMTRVRGDRIYFKLEGSSVTTYRLKHNLRKIDV